MYAVSAILFASGLGWLLVHFFLAGAGEFGDSHHPSEPWWLRLHGAAAMAFLVVFGSLLPRHIVPAWQARKNHRSGLVMVILVAALVLSGYGLYYLGSEPVRAWSSTIHWVLGIAAAAILLLHARLGLRVRAAENLSDRQRWPRPRHRR